MLDALLLLASSTLYPKCAARSHKFQTIRVLYESNVCKEMQNVAVLYKEKFSV